MLSLDSNFERHRRVADDNDHSERAFRVGDVTGRRAAVRDIAPRIAKLHPLPDTVRVDYHVIRTIDGPNVPMRVYRPRPVTPGPAALYVHGGGMITGDLNLYDGIIGRYAQLSGVTIVGVEYRLAPEHPYPCGIDDVYAVLQWMARDAADLGIDDSRIATVGDSAGAGLAAAAALRARDRDGPDLARQILIAPMIDDRMSRPSDHLDSLLTWRYEDNVTGWTALLGAEVGRPGVSPDAAPARATDLSALPPTYIEVGQLDLFCRESIVFAELLNRDGVEVELHVRPGVPHDFDLIAPDSEVAKRAMADRVRCLRLV